MQIPITDEKFEKVKPDTIFALGITTDDQYGLNMTGSGKELKWVAVKGYANDWCIYTHWNEKDWDFVRTQGDKVCDKLNIRRVLDISDKLMEKYRW